MHWKGYPREETHPGTAALLFVSGHRGQFSLSLSLFFLSLPFSSYFSPKVSFTVRADVMPPATVFMRVNLSLHELCSIDF